MEGRTPPQQGGTVSSRPKRARRSRKPVETETREPQSSQNQELPKRILTALVYSTFQESTSQQGRPLGDLRALINARGMLRCFEDMLLFSHLEAIPSKRKLSLTTHLQKQAWAVVCLPLDFVCKQVYMPHNCLHNASLSPSCPNS